MADRSRNVPTLRGQWLGARLRDLRDTAGLTLDEVAEYLGMRHQSTLSRYETGVLPIRWTEVEALLTLYGVSDEAQRVELVDLAKDAWRKGWWEEYGDAYGDAADSRRFLDVVWLESHARHVQTFTTGFVPGLLQIRPYLDALLQDASPDDPQRVRRATELRLARQRILDAAGRPDLTFILNEAVLRQQVGGAETMREQLAHLLQLAARGAVEIRILSFDSTVYRGLYGDFTLYDLGAPLPTVAYLENLAGCLFVESEGVERYLRLYHDLEAAALDRERSAALMKDLIEGARSDRRFDRSSVA